MKRTPLRKVSLRSKKSLKLPNHESSADLKKDIQALLRKIVILRDGTCILRKYRYCEDPVLQADHLITRSNSATYADSRLVVCLCRSCHGGYKQWNKEKYDSMVRTILPKERVQLWDRCSKDLWRPQRMGSVDWKLAKLALEKELKDLEKRNPRMDS